jgi:hypothetical protein
MKSIENLLSVLSLAAQLDSKVLGLAAEPNPISLGRVAQLNPKALGLAVEPNTISLKK